MRSCLQGPPDPAAAEDQVVLVEGDDLPGGDRRLGRRTGRRGSIGKRLDGRRDGTMSGPDLGMAERRSRAARSAS